jgi:hypothetical protein
MDFDEWYTSITIEHWDHKELMLRAWNAATNAERVRWVACDERMPPHGENVTMYLVVNDGYFMTIGFWYPKALEWLDGSGKKIRVKHWSKMPEPPNGSGKPTTEAAKPM